MHAYTHMHAHALSLSLSYALTLMLAVPPARVGPKTAARVKHTYTHTHSLIYITQRSLRWTARPRWWAKALETPLCQSHSSICDV